MNHAGVRYGLVNEDGDFLCLSASPAQARENVRVHFRAWKARQQKDAPEAATFAEYLTGLRFVKLTITNWDPKEVEP